MSSFLQAFYENAMADSREALFIQEDGERLSLDEFVHSFSMVTLLPGQFRSLKPGQDQVFRAMQRLHGRANHTSALEVSIRAIGSVLSLDELASVVEQLSGQYPVLLTNAPTFLEKCGLLSDVSTKAFCIGENTARELVADHTSLGVSGLPANFLVFPVGKARIPDWDIVGKPDNFRQFSFERTGRKLPGR